MSFLKLSSLIDLFCKYSEFSPKFTRNVIINVASLNQAITDLNAAKSLMNPTDSMAITATDKIIKYLSWYRTIGVGGNVSGQGKENLIPTTEEMKQLIRTGFFGKEFIMSLAMIMKLNDSIAVLNNEFTSLQNA